MTNTLIVASSKTGNTRLLARGICDALLDAGHDAQVVNAADMPDDLSAFDAVLFGYWCDRGREPEDILEAARKVQGKRIGCFATLGGDPESAWAAKWMKESSEKLAAAGGGNTLEAAFSCRGRIDPAVFDLMTKMTGGAAAPEREARRIASETHPDRQDVLRAADCFCGMLRASED